MRANGKRCTAFVFTIYQITNGAAAQSPKFDLGSPDGSRAYWNDMIGQGRNADQMATDRAKNPSSGVPNPSELPADVASRAADYVGDKTQNALNSTLASTAKFAPDNTLVENTLEMMQGLDNAWISDPIQRKKFESESEIFADREQMRSEFAVENQKLCSGIPPLICNFLSNNRVECAGGPRVTGQDGIPPWKYTIVARCSGKKFEDFESFDPTGRRETNVRPRITNTGRRYSGNAFSSYCSPCDKAINAGNQNDAPLVRALRKIFN